MTTRAGAARSRRILIIHLFGFLALALLTWANEVVDLPHHLLGAARSPVRLEEALLESLLILGFGAAVSLWLRRMTRRIAYLERFIVLCGWCRRVRLDDDWLSLEAYLQRHDARTSHGICPDCERRLTAEAALPAQ